MKKVLEAATDGFDKKLKLVTDESEESVNISPITVTHHAPLLNDGTDNIAWDSYITYPYILWDPLTQYKKIFKSSPIICPLCSKMG